MAAFSKVIESARINCAMLSNSRATEANSLVV